MTKNIDDIDVSARAKDFSKLLDDISSIDDKKKKLWLEIYQNAITDRQIAHVLFVKLEQIVQDKSTEFAIHGKTLASFIERMAKANDQLIKLADLVAAAEKKPEEFNSDDLYDKMK